MCKSLRRVNFDRAKSVTAAGLARLAALPALEGVYFSQCGVNDAVLKALGACTALKELSVETLEDEGAAITDAGLAHVAGLTKLRKVCLRYAHITDAGLAHIGKFAGLEHLELRAATSWQAPHFTDDGLAALAGLKKLKRLIINHNQFSGSGLAHLKGMDRLEKLRLDGCINMQARHLSHLKALPALAELDLSECSLETGEGPDDGSSRPDTAMAHVGACNALRILDVSNGKFTDKGMAALAALVRLEELDLSQCKQLTDASMESVAKMKSLRKLDLWGLKITAAGIEALKGSSLEELDLSECTGVTDDAVPALAAIKTLRRLKSKFGERSSGSSPEGLRRLRSSNPGLIID